MSAAFFIVLDRADPGFDTMVNGKFLSQDAKRLGKIAKSLGIRPLEEYVSYAPEEARAMMEDLGTDPAEIEGMELPEQKWYEPQEGLDWVGKVSTHIRANPSSVKNAQGVLATWMSTELFSSRPGKSKRDGTSRWTSESAGEHR